MARGQETNLLFNPPKIKKVCTSFLGKRQTLPESAAELLVTDYFTVLKDRLGGLRVLDESWQTDTSKSHRSTPPSALAASGGLMVFGDRDGFTLRDFITTDSPLSFKSGLGEDPAGIYIGGQDLFVIHYLEKEGRPGGNITISKTALSRDDHVGWETVGEYDTPSSNFFFLEKEEKSLLFFRDERGRGTAIFFDHQGPGQATLMQGKIGLALSSKGEPLLSPGEDPHSYFAVSLINDLGERELSFTETSQGMTREEPILAIDQYTEIKDIKTQGNRGLLLTEDTLFFFNSQSQGIEKSWPLGKDAGVYDRLLWTAQGAVLWQAGGSLVQEVDLGAS